MKKLYFLIPIIIAVITLTGCGCSKDGAVTNADDTVRIANDDLEYEVIIIEPGFNQWLATRNPRGFNNQSWLETRNNTLVIEYNNRVQDPQKFDPNLYTQQIYYNRSVDYGYEVNYLLWNWFEFFQERNNQKLQ